MSVHFLSSAETAAGDAPDLHVRAAFAAGVAAAHAEAVDREARLPEEALSALKEARLLGLLVPRELGGEGVSISAVADVCHALGRACSSSGMIFAMHQIKAACLVRHALESPWHRDFLSRAARDQLLLASSTTEGLSGGKVRSSEAPVEVEGDLIRLTRDASVMSYAEAADAVVTTARRSAEAGAADQVLLVLERGDYEISQTRSWSTLGMRGTRSAGFALTATARREQIVPVPYADIHSRTMTPAAHLLWAGVWTGVAGAAVERARHFNRMAARRAGGSAPVGLDQFLKARSRLVQLRSLLQAALAEFERISEDAAALSAVGYQTSITLLKVEASELAQEIVLAALRSCGLSGYRTDGEASVERHLRDILSAPLMINNDRILADVGVGALFAETPARLLRPEL